MTDKYDVNKILILIFTLFIASCGKVDQTTSPADSFPEATPENYFNTASAITLEVYYETGAEPYAGNRQNGQPLWQILDDNLEKAFSFRTRPPERNIPMDLASMQEIKDSQTSQWSADDVFELHQKLALTKPSADHARFYIYFLNGNASSSNNVIGFSINGTPIIAIFKNVIRNSGGFYVRRFVEQSTLVDEIGHALGLVNNVIPMQTNHQDTENGSHTMNSDGVMYWQNEGAADMANFVAKYITSGETIMWCPEVLADLQGFSN